MRMTQEKVLEAALFMSSRPLMLDELGRMLGVHSLGYVKELLEKLQKDYSGRGVEIVSTPQGWTMQVKQELLDKVSHLTPYSDIKEGSKRSLALIAYKEPVQQSEIIRIQGNKAYSYLKDLQKRSLVKAEKKGRTKVFRLTQEFERYFGEEKQRIKERLESSQRVSPEGQEKPEGRRPRVGRRQQTTSVSETPSSQEGYSGKEKAKAQEPEPRRPKRKSDIDTILT